MNRKMTTIYCKDEEEQHRLQGKYPELDATWLPIPDDKMEENMGTPLVCKNDEPMENCLVGEQHIERILSVQHIKE